MFNIKKVIIVTLFCFFILVSTNIALPNNFEHQSFIGSGWCECGSRGTGVSSQHITTNTTWTALNSPYYIEGDVYVDYGVNLTIEPNVVIKFNGFYSIYIAGNLTAIGSEASPIEFTSNITGPRAGDWNSLQITDTGYMILKFVKISFGNKSLFIEGASNNLIDNLEISNSNMYGAWISQSDNNVITNSKFDTNAWGGIYLDSSLNNEFMNCSFDNNDYDGITADYSSGNSFLNCTFNNNFNDGLHLLFSGNVQVINCTATDNKETGLVFASSSYCTIENVEANSNNKIGIYVKESKDNNILDCNFSSNGKGLYFYSSSNIDIKNSIFTANNEIGIYFEDSSDNNIVNCELGFNINYGIFITEEYIYLKGSPNNKITNSRIFNSTYGMYLKGAPNSILSDLEIMNNSYGIFFYNSSDSNLEYSEIFNNNINGIRVVSSSDINVSDCEITDNRLGILIGSGTLRNRVHHNNFRDNTFNAADGAVGNYWDDGISEGNYWDDYNGTDLDHNGIGDEPHPVSNFSRDNYPLVDQYNIVLKVLSTDPENDAILQPLNLTVNITFSEQLNRASVIGNITISPEAEILGYEWYDKDAMVSLQLATLKNGTTYYVTINPEVTNFTGKALKFPYTFRFTTEDPYNYIRPYVVEHFPVGEDVPITTTIKIKFSFPMYRASVEEAFSIYPDVRVDIKWENDVNVIFTPVTRLDVLTQYDVSISTAALNLIGNSMETSYLFSFLTESDRYPPNVIDRYPTGIDLVSAKLESIIIIFDEPVYTKSVEVRFETLPTAPGDFEWQDNNRKMYYELESELLYNMWYTVRLLPGLMDTNRNPTEKVYEFKFRTVPGINPTDLPPRVIDRYPTGGVLVPVETEYLLFAFNEPVETSSVEVRFKISPPTYGNFEWQNNDQTMYYKFTSNLLYNITYTMKLYPGITDVEGTPSEEFYQFPFTTVPGVSPFDVLEYSPQGNDVPVNTTIEIIFNKDANHTSIENAFVIDPNIEGTFNWNDTALFFTPLSVLNYNTTYSVLVGDWVKDITGVALGTSLNWEFTTRAEGEDGDGEEPNGNVTPSPPEEDGDSASEEFDYLIWLAIGIAAIIVLIIIIIGLVFGRRGKEPEPELKEKAKRPRPSPKLKAKKPVKSVKPKPSSKLKAKKPVKSVKSKPSPKGARMKRPRSKPKALRKRSKTDEKMLKSFLPESEAEKKMFNSFLPKSSEDTGKVRKPKGKKK